MSRTFYEKDGAEITICDINDLNKKTDFTRFYNDEENLGSNVIERVIKTLETYKPAGFSVITVYGSTVSVIGGYTSVESG